MLSKHYNIRNLVFIALFTAATGCGAQAFPTKPIRVVVPYPPGGVDVLARVILTEMSKGIGQPVILENRAGANGIIGADVVARAAPDGYTLLVCASSTLITSVILSKNVPFHSVRDFTPVGNMYESIQALAVRMALPVDSIRELLDMAKKFPGKLTYASSGIGSAFHFQGEALKLMAGVDMLHVPYKGTGPAAVAIIAGEVDVAFPSYGNLGGNVNKVKIIGLTSAQRSPRIPNVPAVAETIPGFKRVPGWIAMFGPAGMQLGIVNRLNAEVNSALKSKEVTEAFEQQYTTSLASTPAELGAIVRGDLEQGQKIANAVGLKPE
ncbi:MAG: tripartite tricarboxylate transporter substrate binding protein [Betaproteobacteria bacterium]|nr:tripartite tricarboxylate transporter substrate binding protein [Betaproteobacteria bacterium]